MAIRSRSRTGATGSPPLSGARNGAAEGRSPDPDGSRTLPAPCALAESLNPAVGVGMSREQVPQAGVLLAADVQLREQFPGAAGGALYLPEGTRERVAGHRGGAVVGRELPAPRQR